MLGFPIFQSRASLSLLACPGAGTFLENRMHMHTYMIHIYLAIYLSIYLSISIYMYIYIYIPVCIPRQVGW